MLAFAGRASSLAACMSLLSALSFFCVVFFLTGEYGRLPLLQHTSSDSDTRAPPSPQTSLDRHDVAAPSSSTETARSPAVVNSNVSTTVKHATAVSTTSATSAKPAITEERTAPATQGKTTASISAITQAAVVNTETKIHPTKTHRTQPNSNGLYLSVPENCAEPNCMEFLSLSEKRAIQLCEKDVTRHAPDRKIQSTTCKFLKGDGRDPVALNSQEGSGNTWVRALLERATGVCTGFNWGCDPVLRAHGFLGEGIRSGRVLVVKTHVRTPKWKGEVWKGPVLGYEPFYTSAVLILRHPARAMIADYNRQRTTTKGLDSHTNTLSQAVFAEGSRDWIRFSDEYLVAWKTRMVTWVINNNAKKHPVHVVRYEDLQKDTVGEVERILDFLKFRYTHEDVVERLKEGYREFQRSHNHTDFQHFSETQRGNLRRTLMETWDLAKRSGKSELLRLDDYIAALDDIK